MKRCVRDLPEWKRFWRATADQQCCGPTGSEPLATAPGTRLKWGLILRAQRVSPRLARPLLECTLGSRSAWEKVTVKRAAARSIEDLSASPVRRIPRSRGRRRRPRSNFPWPAAPLEAGSARRRVRQRFRASAHDAPMYHVATARWRGASLLQAVQARRAL
jgi:hypothetical protein